MKKLSKSNFIIRLSALFTAVCALVSLLPLYSYAVDLSAYEEILKQEAVYVINVSMDGLYEYFKASTTDEITKPEECNYIYGPVTVNGTQVNCHVYMRTFSITDISEYTIEQATAMLPEILSRVRQAVADKYLKCITKSYSINVSGVKDEANDRFLSFTVRILFATGEKTEDRAALIENYIKPNAEAMKNLETLERFTALNSLMLDGRFTYDITLTNRSSAVEFVKGGTGVCEEYAALISLFLDELGYENIIITGTENNGVKHMWNMVKADGRWYHLDILWDGSIDETGKHIFVTRDYLLVSTEKILKTRTYDRLYEPFCELAVYDYIFENLPQGVNGTVIYNGIEYLSGVPSGITVSELRERTQLNDFLEITDPSGAVLTEEAKIGTGYILVLKVNGVVKGSYIICVKGDVDGDGEITNNDISRIKDYRLGKAGKYEDTFFLACDLNLDGAVTLTDMITAFDIMNGSYTEPEPPQEEVTDPEETTAPEETMPPEDTVPSEDTSAPEETTPPEEV